VIFHGQDIQINYLSIYWTDIRAGLAKKLLKAIGKALLD
jgi:hypothetical protein